MVQKKLPLINSAHGSETRNIINELIKLFNGMGYTYDEALQKAHDVLDEAQKTNNLNNNTNERLDNLIADSGTSSTEVVDARGSATVLSQRLNSMENQTETKSSYLSSNQTNFYTFLTDNIFNEVALTKISSTEMELVAQNDVEGVGYYLLKDPTDDFFKLGKGFHFGRYQKKGQVSFTTHGTWDKEYTNWFTEIENDYFEFTFTGTKATIPFYARANGGLFEIITSDHQYARVSVNGQDVYKNYELNFKPGTHTVKVIFKGADPLNPVSNARGFVLGGQNVIEVETELGRTGVANLLHENSNKEFAFSVNHNGSSFWFPEHNGVGTMYDHTMSIRVDTTPINLDDLSINQSVKGSRVDIHQFMTGYATGKSTELATFRIQHRLSKNGIIKYNGLMTALNNFTISAGYPLMLPADGATQNIVISSFGTKKTNDNTGDYYYFKDEEDSCFGVMTSTNISGYGNYITFAQVDRPLITLRHGKANKPRKDESMFLWQRSNVPKTYFQSMSSKPMVKGEKYEWSGKIGVYLFNNQASFI